MLEMAFFFLQVGVIAFGGGWSIVGFLKESVIARGYASEAAFANMVSLAQLTPGPVAVNIATFVGFQRYGIVGGLLNTLCIVLPAVFIYSVIVHLTVRSGKKDLLSGGRFIRSIRGSTLVLVGATLVSLTFPRILDPKTAAIALLAGLGFVFTKINPLFLILGSGAAGLVLTLLFQS